MSRKGCVWISRSAVADLLDEAELWWPLETGGVLLGYESGADVVVERVVGPGGQAKHSSTGYKPDGGFHGLAMERVFRESDGAVYYLGDWHTHPGGSVRMSRRDELALAGIADFDDSHQPHPLMLVAARGEDQPWRFVTWRFVSRWRLGPYSRVRLRTIRPKVFD